MRAPFYRARALEKFLCDAWRSRAGRPCHNEEFEDEDEFEDD